MVLRERCTFTNGSDAGTVVELYRKTATAVLGSTRELTYRELGWRADDYERLGEALRYCGSLETLTLKGMGLGEADAAAIVAGLASCKSLQTLNLMFCDSLTPKQLVIDVAPVCMTFEDFYCGFTPDSHPAFSCSPSEGALERRGGPNFPITVHFNPKGANGELVGHLLRGLRTARQAGGRAL